VRKVPEGVKFNIIDTGIGIPEDKIQAVFDSFSQANTSDTRKYGGTGLGLSISQQLIEMMDSTIEIESKEDYGTTFSFIINFEKGSIESLIERNSKDDTIDGTILDGLKILVVDDNEYNIIVARDTLKSKANLEIQEATNGQDAIDLVRKNKFDVILMDIQMPVMNGFDATQYIRTHFESPVKDTPIIALTASVLRTDLDKCIDAGMNSYIPKPFKAYQLIGEIAEVLNIPMKKKRTSLKDAPEISSGEVTDLTYLTNFCEGDKDRIKKYIEMFLASAPAVVEKIKFALVHGDFEEVANQVHGFKTKCMMMGMTETKDLSNTIEQLCREKPNEEIIKEKVLELITKVKKAEIELRN
jgi:CheY-like chemotaxis protein